VAPRASFEVRRDSRIADVWFFDDEHVVSRVGGSVEVWRVDTLEQHEIDLPRGESKATRAAPC
jgi:hypothetical protein